MAKISENSVKVLNFLKENDGKNFTSNDVANALDLTVATVNGVFTSLVNKKYGYRQEATVPGAVDISFLSITEKGKETDVTELSENAQAIIGYFKTVEGQDITADDACAALEIDKRKFTGAFNSLVKKELCARTSAKVEAPVTVKYLVLTDEGRAYTPEVDG